MANFGKRLEALETGIIDHQLVEGALGREADITGWLLSDGGNVAEKSAVFGHILNQVDGRSKGLPSELNGGVHVQD